MPATNTPPAERCLNCGASLDIEPAPHWCPRCGQETRLHPPTLREFMHEFVGHYVALEGALWRTLKALCLQPGRLTREYLDGRRRHYVLPLRLYLSASFLFFLLVKLGGLGNGPEVEVSVSVPVPSAASAPSAGGQVSVEPATAGTDREDLQGVFAWAKGCVAVPGSCSAQETRLARNIERLSRNDSPVAEFGRHMASSAPYVVFLMLPVFAGLLKLAMRRSGLPYGAHYVFGLHLHAFWFLVLLVLAPLPDALSAPAMLGMWLHGVAAMRRVYGTPWGLSLRRALVVSVLYGLLLVLATGLVAGGWLLK